MLIILIIFLYIQEGDFFLNTFPTSFVRSWGQTDNSQIIYSPEENLDTTAYRNIEGSTGKISQLPHKERFKDSPKNSIYFR